MISVGDKINSGNNNATEYEAEKYIGHGSYGLIYSVKDLKSNIR